MHEKYINFFYIPARVFQGRLKLSQNQNINVKNSHEGFPFCSLTV